MARIRSIKPEFFTSEAVSRLSLAARLTFIGMWTEADDHGNLVDSPRILKGHLWPLEDDVSPIDLSLHIQALLDLGLVERYEVENRRYLHICSWEEHQKINRKSLRRHPPCPSESIEVPRENTRSEPAVSTHKKIPQEVEVEVEVEQGGGGGVHFAARSLRDASSNGRRTDTTTTTLPEITKALELVADALTADKPRDDPASYRARIIANGDDHRARLDRMAAPGDTPEALAERYLAARKRGTATKAPRCGVCGAGPHPDGVCPTLGDS